MSCFPGSASCHALYCPDCEPEAFGLGAPPSARAAVTGCVGTFACGTLRITTHRRHRGKWQSAYHGRLTLAELLAASCTANDALREEVC